MAEYWLGSVKCARCVIRLEGRGPTIKGMSHHDNSVAGAEPGGACGFGGLHCGLAENKRVGPVCKHLFIQAMSINPHISCTLRVMVSGSWAPLPATSNMHAHPNIRRILWVSLSRDGGPDLKMGFNLSRLNWTIATETVKNKVRIPHHGEPTSTCLPPANVKIAAADPRSRGRGCRGSSSRGPRSGCRICLSTLSFHACLDQSCACVP